MLWWKIIKREVQVILLVKWWVIIWIGAKMGVTSQTKSEWVHSRRELWNRWNSRFLFSLALRSEGGSCSAFTRVWICSNSIWVRIRSGNSQEACPLRRSSSSAYCFCITISLMTLKHSIRYLKFRNSRISHSFRIPFLRNGPSDTLSLTPCLLFSPLTLTRLQTKNECLK